jgi:hypothetical protein
MILVRVVVALAGVLLVGSTLVSALRTFVLPRGVPDRLSRAVFAGVRVLFDLRTSRAKSYLERDRAMALYAPVSLLVLPVAWLIFVGAGCSCIFWAADQQGWTEAVELSGSSLLTLGFANMAGLSRALIAFSEAIIGLGLVALLIAYLPTMYAAWSRREEAVALLEVRAGSPPSAVELLLRYFRIGAIDRLPEVWENWEVWFANIDESHTSLAALSFFRSPTPQRSWVTAAGAVLDAAALSNSTLAIPHHPSADLCLRAGYTALRRIATFFRIDYDPHPRPFDPISIAREEYNEAYERLAAEGLPMKPDREEGWLEFAGWRVNYDTVLLGLTTLTMAPEAPWSSDRSLRRPRRKRKRGV